MAPVAEVVLLTVVAFCVFLIGFLFRRFHAADVQTGIIVFFASLGVLLGLERVAWWAILIFAGGIAFQSTRIVQRWPAEFDRFLNVSGIILVSVVAATAAYVAFAVSASNQQGLAGNSARRPNVILVIWDTVRALSTSVTGYERRTTPFLEKLGNKGVVFERAYAAAPWTLPSHVSMFTGLHHHQMDVGWAREFRDHVPTLPEEMAAGGYRTGAFVANLIYADAEHGLARGFHHYSDHSLSFGEVLSNSATLRWLFKPGVFLARLTGPRPYLWHKDAAKINNEFLDWVDHGRGAPFFAFLNYFDAHHPYAPPSGFQNRFGKINRPNLLERLSAPFWSEDLEGDDVDDERIAEELRAYEASIAYLDHQLERLVAQLEKRGILHNTLIIVTSDHGEEFGEHGKYTHGQTLYLPALHVPLVVAHAPLIPANVRVRTPVSLRDVAATILDITQLPSRRIPGQSWRPFWEDSAVGNPQIVISAGSRDLYSAGLDLSLINERFHYIDSHDSPARTFDLLDDPLQLAPLAHPVAALRDVAERIRACDETKGRRTPQCPAGSLN